MEEQKIKKGFALFKKSLILDLQQVNNLKQYESLPILMTGKDRENDWTHIVIKDWHHNQSFFMQFTESTKQILRSLL